MSEMFVNTLKYAILKEITYLGLIIIVNLLSVAIKSFVETVCA